MDLSEISGPKYDALDLSIKPKPKHHELFEDLKFFIIPTKKSIFKKIFVNNYRLQSSFFYFCKQQQITVYTLQSDDRKIKFLKKLLFPH